MPTIKERYRCHKCGRRLVRSKMIPIIVWRDIKWVCRKCPKSHDHRKKSGHQENVSRPKFKTLRTACVASFLTKIQKKTIYDHSY